MGGGGADNPMHPSPQLCWSCYPLSSTARRTYTFLIYRKDPISTGQRVTHSAKVTFIWIKSCYRGYHLRREATLVHHEYVERFLEGWVVIIYIRDSDSHWYSRVERRSPQVCCHHCEVDPRGLFSINR